MIETKPTRILTEILHDERSLAIDLHEGKRTRLLEDIRRMRIHLAKLEHQALHEDDDYRGDCC